MLKIFFSTHMTHQFLFALIISRFAHFGVGAFSFALGQDPTMEMSPCEILHMNQ